VWNRDQTEASRFAMVALQRFMSRACAQTTQSTKLKFRLRLLQLLNRWRTDQQVPNCCVNKRLIGDLLCYCKIVFIFWRAVSQWRSQLANALQKIKGEIDLCSTKHLDLSPPTVIKCCEQTLCMKQRGPFVAQRGSLFLLTRQGATLGSHDLKDRRGPLSLQVRISNLNISQWMEWRRDPNHIGTEPKETEWERTWPMSFHQWACRQPKP
jgi:hypothetical protein